MDADSVAERLRKTIDGDDDASVLTSERPAFLDLRPLTGGWTAIPYAFIRRVEFDPNKREQLFIDFGTHTASMAGINLDSLYTSLQVRRVSVVAQVSEFEVPDDSATPVVHRLVIRVTAREKKAAAGEPELQLWEGDGDP